MTRKCFFAENVGAVGATVELSGQTARHIERVLRMRPGERLELRDGAGNGWDAVIERIGRGMILARITGKQPHQNEPPLDLTLGVSFARSDRMDLTVRQATELGINRFVAYRSRRSQYALAGVQEQKRLDRWLKIAREAMCQCGRMRVPEIEICSSLLDFISSAEKGQGIGKRTLKISAWEKERQKTLLDLWKLFPQCDRIIVAVGPEGGWSEEEVELLKKADFHPVHLGPRILRLETAAAAVVTSVQLLWGDFGNLDERG